MVCLCIFIYIEYKIFLELNFVIIIIVQKVFFKNFFLKMFIFYEM